MDESLKVGDHIRLLAMRDDPDPVPAGTRGKVQRIHEHNDWTQVEVDWENGRKLMLTLPEDKFEVIDPETTD